MNDNWQVTKPEGISDISLFRTDAVRGPEEIKFLSSLTSRA